MRIVSVKSLTEGMKLAKPVYKNGVILLNKGANKLLTYQKRLLDLGINYVYVNDYYSQDIVINDVIKEETRHKSEKTIKETFESVYFTEEFNVREVKQVVSGLMNEILNSDITVANLFNIKDYDSYTYSHSVNVAAVSMLIGRLINLSDKQIVRLGEGAIMHDIGKVNVPQEITKKPDVLTTDEYNVIREHPRLGYHFLKDNNYMSPVSRIVVLSHHERVDGSGYPDQLEGKDIHLFARIAALADVFDALSSDRPYRRRWSIRKTVDYMISQADTKFDYSLMETFARKIAVYPNGITVLLNNGQKALVKEQNKGYPTRPVLKVITDEKGKTLSKPYIIDLLEELNIEIDDSL